MISLAHELFMSEYYTLTLNMEILDLLNEESVSGVCSGRASL